MAVVLNAAGFPFVDDVGMGPPVMPGVGGRAECGQAGGEWSEGAAVRCPGTTGWLLAGLGSVEGFSQFARNIVQGDLVGVDGNKELVVGLKIIVQRHDKAIDPAFGMNGIALTGRIDECQDIVLDLIVIEILAEIVLIITFLVQGHAHDAEEGRDGEETKEGHFLQETGLSPSGASDEEDKDAGDNGGYSQYDGECVIIGVIDLAQFFVMFFVKFEIPVL